ncbi:MAG TPA: hypothetical protein VK815_16945 [Candidatus Acidoferrales bacterium]|jgi:alpha-tubulin suppressor-like RCC1 family protein|nr:hypothetical protein [Candidatus Acidoferrales bacterium]
MKTIQKPLLLCCLLAFGQLLQAAPPSGWVIEWGWNTATGMAAPAKQVLSDVVTVSVGSEHCLALKSDGTVIAWGGNFRGEATFDSTVLTTGEGGFTDKSGFHLTHGNTTTILTNGAIEINGRILGDVIAVAAGNGFGLALKKDRTITTWGENYAPAGLTNVMGIAVAAFTSFALKNDGRVVEWISQKSHPEFGQLIEALNVSNVLALAIGITYQGTRNVALKSDGTVIHWGSESTEKEATPPAGLSNVVAIAVGSSHTLALKSDGTVIGWGFNEVGQATGVPTTNSPNTASGQVMVGGQVLSNVVSIAANHGYSMALKKDGTIVTWGRMVNNLYPATVPDGLSGVVAIAAGENFCLAITTNSAVAEKFRQK